MEPVILVVHLFLALAIIGLVLLQRSEGGGGLGIGSAGGFATPRGAANALTRATAICAAAFFCTSLVLGVMAGGHSATRGSLMDALNQSPAVAEQAEAPVNGAEDNKDAADSEEPPAVPIAE